MARAWRWAAAGVAAWAGWKALQRMQEEDLRGQVVAILGGSRGLGFLLAREFAREGCQIALCARSEEELEHARRALAAHGAEVMVEPCDVRDQAAVERFVRYTLSRFGRLDVLVNNAGIIQVGPMRTMELADYRDAMDTMFWGPLYGTLAVLPHMFARRRGRIVNVTSIGGMVGMPNLLPYTCAKSAAVGLSEGLRTELAGTGIRVTTIVPGLMRVGSYLHAEYRGEAASQYRWFSAAASLPFLTIQGERAARQIVRATRRGDPIRILGLPAQVLERLHGLFPGTTARAFGLLRRLLPGRAPPPRVESMTGQEAELRVHSRLHDLLTAPGRAAARRTLEIAGDGEEA